MKKYIKYLSYLIRHKWFVLIECFKKEQFWRGITHDLSKFRLDEFIPYAKYFYGNYPDWNKVKYNGHYLYRHTKQGVEEAFDLAWLKHQHRNPHHWQHWVLREDSGNIKCLDMPDNYLEEMICDWTGAGRAITGNNDPKECKKWYLKNYNKIHLSKWSRTRVNAKFDICGDDLLEVELDKRGELYKQWVVPKIVQS